jgi:hypothetical protein
LFCYHPQVGNFVSSKADTKGLPKKGISVPLLCKGASSKHNVDTGYSYDYAAN